MTGCRPAHWGRAGIQVIAINEIDMSCESSENYAVTLRVSEDQQVVLTEAWEQEGQLSCSHRPSLVERSGLTGQITAEVWYRDGQEHRADAPAIIEYGDDDKRRVVLEIWKWNGKRHRRGGPAVIEWNNAGDLLRIEWWIHGRQVTPPQ